MNLILATMETIPPNLIGDMDVENVLLVF